MGSKPAATIALPGRLGVLDEQVDVAVRARERVLVVLCDLGAFHQDDRAFHRSERALEHEWGDQRRRGGGACRGDRVQRRRPAEPSIVLRGEEVDAVVAQVGLARSALDQSGDVRPEGCVVHDLLVIRRVPG